MVTCLVSSLLDADALFSLPPAEFTAARDALAKQLRSEQRRAEAAEVKALRRPSVAAWAVNQLARRHPDALDRLEQAGAQLVSAQRRALSGVRDAGLLDAGRARRAAVEDVWKTVADILVEQGSDPQSQRQAVTETLEAASVDPEAAAAVRAGRLSRELAAPSDFGAVSGLTVVEDSAPAQVEPGSPGLVAEERQKSKQREHARSAAREAAEQAEAAQGKAADARREALRLGDEAQRLQERADEAAEQARRAQGHAQELAEAAERARVKERQLAAAAEELG